MHYWKWEVGPNAGRRYNINQGKSRIEVAFDDFQGFQTKRDLESRISLILSKFLPFFLSKGFHSHIKMSLSKHINTIEQRNDYHLQKLLFCFFFCLFFSVFIREYFRTLHGFFSFFLTPLPCGIHQITGLGNPSFFYPFLLSSNRWGQTCYLPASFSSSAFSSSVYFCFYLVSLV